MLVFTLDRFVLVDSELEFVIASLKLLLVVAEIYYLLLHSPSVEDLLFSLGLSLLQSGLELSYFPLDFFSLLAMLILMVDVDNMIIMLKFINLNLVLLYLLVESYAIIHFFLAQCSSMILL